MNATRKGAIKRGNTIVLDNPISLPDGSEVVVSISYDRSLKVEPPKTQAEDITGLPFFGMWEDRQDMQDSEAWVKQQREAWHKRRRDDSN